MLGIDLTTAAGGGMSLDGHPRHRAVTDIIKSLREPSMVLPCYSLGMKVWGGVGEKEDLKKNKLLNHKSI